MWGIGRTNLEIWICIDPCAKYLGRNSQKCRFQWFAVSKVPHSLSTFFEIFLFTIVVVGGVTRNSWALSSELVSDLCYMIVTMKYLTAKQKAEELGITLSGLRKTRHLYKHIPKGPRKYLYFAEDPQEVVRTIKAIAPLGSLKSKDPKEGRTLWWKELS